jgi:DNA-binding HxlR family transcriptional regulator
MAVREERAVRAGPGTAKGRRAPVGGETPRDETLDPLLESSGDSAALPIVQRVPRVFVVNPYALVYSLEQHRGSFEILLLLDREGSATKYRMRDQLMPRREALDGAIRCLERMGLIDMEKGRRFPFENRYRLTRRGQEFAATLRAWSELLRE